jgi:hypothetical protein
MKSIAKFPHLGCAFLTLFAWSSTVLLAQGPGSQQHIAQEKDKPTPSDAKPDSRPGAQYSGMYTFLQEGEFVQITVEDEGRVTGFVSRYGDQDSDKGAFLDQFFKSGKLEGDKLEFVTETVHGVWYGFKGAVERGEGKNPGDEAYYVLKGTLTESVTDANKKVTSKSRAVSFKAFPQEASPQPVKRE